MNELVKINSLGCYGGVPTVFGRELHEALEVETRYNDWFARMCEYGFVEGEDYYSFLSNRSDGRAGKPRTDHALTIDTAKEICMLQRTETGRTIRRYFIETEKQYRQQAGNYSDLLWRQNELESRLNQLESKLSESKENSFRLPKKSSLQIRQENAVYIMEKLEQSGEITLTKSKLLRICRILKARELTEALKLLDEMQVISYQKIQNGKRGKPKEIIVILKTERNDF